MQRVITIAIFVPLIFLFSCSSQHESKNIPAIKFNIPNVILTAKIDSSYVKDTLQYIFVKVNLSNLSLNTLKYITMTCSWDQSFTTSSKVITMLRNICYSNWYYTAHISPLKSEDYSLTLLTSSSLKELRFNVGFNLIQPQDVLNMDSVFQYLPDMKHVIWSNPIDLK